MSILFTGTIITFRLIQLCKYEQETVVHVPIEEKKEDIQSCNTIIPQFTNKESQTSNQILYTDASQNTEQILYKDASQNTTPTIEQQDEDSQASTEDYITIGKQSPIKPSIQKSFWQIY